MDRAIKKLPLSRQKTLRSHVFTSPGLSFNQENAKNKKNTVQHVLKNFFPATKGVLIWHDVVNNSLSKYPGNNFTPLVPKGLLEILRSFSQIETVLYVQRDGTPDIFSLLKGENFLTLHILKDLISKRKAKSPTVLFQYRELHQHWTLEIKSLRLVSKYSDNLKLLQKSRRKRINPRRRLALKRKQALTEV